MKVTVIGSHLCPDTLYALNKLVEAKADITFQNLSASLPDLKAYFGPAGGAAPSFEGPNGQGRPSGIPLLRAGGRHRHPGAGAGAQLSGCE